MLTLNRRTLEVALYVAAILISFVYVGYDFDRVWFWRPDDLGVTLVFALVVARISAAVLEWRVNPLVAVVGPGIVYWLATGLYVEGLSALYLCAIGYSVGALLQRILGRVLGQQSGRSARLDFSLTTLIGFAALTILLPPALTFVPHFLFFKAGLWLLPACYVKELWQVVGKLRVRVAPLPKVEIARLSAVAVGMTFAATFCNIPDVTFDSLLMHLNIPFRLNTLGGTFLDPAQVYWAFYPQGIDHLFAVATWGLDFITPKMISFLALLLAINVFRKLLGETRLRTYTVAFCLACPILLQQVTQSFIDLIWSIYIVLAALIFRARGSEKDGINPFSRTFTVTLFLLAGCASKLFTACYLIPFLPFLVPALLRLKPREMGAVMILGFLALWWGWYGFLRTGNPIFPLYNNLWHSPLFSTEPFGDNRWYRTLSWRSLWDLTLNANYFGEIDPGAFGLSFTFALPLACLAALRAHRRSGPRFLLFILLVGGVLVLCLQPYYRYLLPTVLGLHVLAAYAPEDENRGWIARWLNPSLVWFAAIALVGSQGWFARHPLMHRSVRGRREYLAKSLPYLPLFRAINDAADIDRILVAPPDFSALVGLIKPAYLNNVYSQLVARRFSALQSDEELSTFMKDLGVREFMVKHDQNLPVLSHFGCRRRFENVAFDLITCR